VVVVPDHPRGEAGSEDVAVAIVATIEPLGVRSVEVLHPRREALGRRLDDEVVMRAHQAEGVALPAVALDDEGEQREEEASVVVVEVDETAKDASRRDLEDAVRQVATPDARHVADRIADAPAHTHAVHDSARSWHERLVPSGRV
jgi:hypothetical protein